MKTKPLISIDEVRGFLGWPKAAKPLIWLLFGLLGWHRLNRAYGRYAHVRGLAFAEAILTDRMVNVTLAGDERDRIPRQGGVVFAANHPLGAMDGLALLHTIAAVRPDVRILGNALLERIEPLSPYLIGVVPFEGAHRNPVASGRGLLEAKTWVEQGGALIMFPAGEVARWSYNPWGVRDRPWPKASQRFLAEIPSKTIAVALSARRPWWFNLASFLSTGLQTMLMPRLALQRNVDLRLNFGDETAHETAHGAAAQSQV